MHAAQANPQRPNLLILLSDQLRRQALGCYGDPDARTPHMDKLARDGVQFTAANSTYPVCVPYRFSLMTGETAHSRLIPAIEWAMAQNEEARAKFIKDRQIYYAMVENLDNNVGRMLDVLEQQGLADNTVIVITSDHGELNGAHGLHSKQWPYEESVGVPLIVRDPRLPQERRGSTVGDPICTEDLFPTFLGLTGLTPGNPLPGLDLTPLIHGKQKTLNREGVLLELVAEHRKGFPFHDEIWRGVRTRRYKYTTRGDKFGAKPWQFFDLERDPFECENRLDDPDCQEEIARHHGLLVNLLKETIDPYVLLPAYGHAGVNLWE